MKQTLILGLDPGISGAYALYDAHNDHLRFTRDFPTKKEKTKNRIDSFAFNNAIGIYASEIQFAVLEDVHAMTGQGVTSMFTFGEAKGLISGIVSAYNIPIYGVDPSVWKLSMGLSYKKELSVAKAIKLFPKIQRDVWEGGKGHNRAEAALLAYFGKRFYQKDK